SVVVAVVVVGVVVGVGCGSFAGGFLPLLSTSRTTCERLTESTRNVAFCRCRPPIWKTIEAARAGVLKRTVYRVQRERLGWNRTPLPLSEASLSAWPRLLCRPTRTRSAPLPFTQTERR